MFGKFFNRKKKETNLIYNKTNSDYYSAYFAPIKAKEIKEINLKRKVLHIKEIDFNSIDLTDAMHLYKESSKKDLN